MKNEKESIISNRRNSIITLNLINYAIEKYPEELGLPYRFHMIRENEYKKFFLKYINILIKQIPILKKNKSIMIEGAENNTEFINDFKKYLFDINEGKRFSALQMLFVKWKMGDDRRCGIQNYTGYFPGRIQYEIMELREGMSIYDPFYNYGDMAIVLVSKSCYKKEFFLYGNSGKQNIDYFFTALNITNGNDKIKINIVSESFFEKPFMKNDKLIKFDRVFSAIFFDHRNQDKTILSYQEVSNYKSPKPKDTHRFIFDYILEMLKPNGKAFLIVPYSFLAIKRTQNIRKMLIDNNVLESIIYTNNKKRLWKSVNVETAILILNKKKKKKMRNKVYFFDTGEISPDKMYKTPFNVIKKNEEVKCLSRIFDKK